jgi:AraC-like DNA-binding protein
MRSATASRVTTRPAEGTPPPFRPSVFWTSRDAIAGAARYPAHVHAHHELIVCERGQYRCRIAGGELSLRPGEALLVNPGDAHEDPLAGPVSYLACGFRLLPAADPARSPALLRPGAPPAARLLPAGGAALALLVERLRAAVAAPPDRYGWAVLDAVCAAWLWETVRSLPTADLAPAFRLHAAATDPSARLHAAFAGALTGNATLAGLARQSGLAPRAFATACRRHLGMAPLAAFRHARCSAAAALLAQGASVAEAAARFGFANPFHFSRAFRRVLGVPPSAWCR